MRAEWMTSVRIALIVTGGLDRGGRQRVIPALLAFVGALARRHEVHAFVLRHYPEPCRYELLGATVHDLGRADGVPGLGRWRQAGRLLAAMTRVGPFDLLHAYWGVPAGVVGTAIAERLGIPSIVTLDSGELVALPDIGYGLQRRWRDRRAMASTLRRASQLTVCTAYMASLSRAHGAVVAEVPLGVEPHHFPQSLPQSAPTPGSSWRLLHVASLNPVKDQATLLRALARVVAREPRVMLDIVGEDTLNGEIQRLARTLQIESSVTFHGFQPTDALGAFYQRAHLHVVSSRHEAAGVVTLEAACAGVPTIGTRVGYVADWDGERAVAVDVGDADALAAGILALLADPDRRARLGAAARAWALEHSVEWTAARFDTIYREAVASHSRRAARTSR
jgi:glycosyltransferase involved in cell wall biosynthesis